MGILCVVAGRAVLFGWVLCIFPYNLNQADNNSSHRISIRRAPYRRRTDTAERNQCGGSGGRTTGTRSATASGPLLTVLRCARVCVRLQCTRVRIGSQYLPHVNGSKQQEQSASITLRVFVSMATRVRSHTHPHTHLHIHRAQFRINCIERRWGRRGWAQRMLECAQYVHAIMLLCNGYAKETTTCRVVPCTHECRD